MWTLSERVAGTRTGTSGLDILPTAGERLGVERKSGFRRFANLADTSVRPLWILMIAEFMPLAHLLFLGFKHAGTPVVLDWLGGGEEALHHLGGDRDRPLVESPDAILVDAVLHGMSTRDLLLALRAMPDVARSRIALMADSSASAVTAIGPGLVDAVIARPVTPETLLPLFS